MLLKLLYTTCLVLQFLLTYSQPRWELTKDKNGISVYSAKEFSSKFKSIKVEGIFPGTIQKLVAILQNVNDNKEWVYRTKQSYLIRNINANELIYYAETELPWPISNRDMAIKMHFNLDNVNNLKVKATGVPDTVPEKEGLVRIKLFNAEWDVKNLGNSRISIQYFLTMDPGGSMPPGISNMFVSKGPYETFYSLAQLLEK
jgi:hypothetical protein